MGCRGSTQRGKAGIVGLNEVVSGIVKRCGGNGVYSEVVEGSATKGMRRGLANLAWCGGLLGGLVGRDEMLYIGDGDECDD